RSGPRRRLPRRPHRSGGDAGGHRASTGELHGAVPGAVPVDEGDSKASVNAFTSSVTGRGMPMLELPNTSIIDGNAVRWGRMGSGPPLVAIHGTPFSSQVWRRMVPHLADRRTIYFFDLVGYGQSEMRDGQDVSLA